MLSESIAAAAHIGRFALFHVSNSGDMGHPAFCFFNDDSSEAFDSMRCDCRRRLRKGNNILDAQMASKDTVAMPEEQGGSGLKKFLIWIGGVLVTIGTACQIAG